MRLLLAFTVIAVFVPVASARQGITVYGLGLQSCGEWNRASDEAARGEEIHRGMLTTWVQGYVTGAAAGLGSRRRLRNTDQGGLQSWIDKHCAEEPLSTIHVAAGKLVIELFEQ